MAIFLLLREARQGSGKTLLPHSYHQAPLEDRAKLLVMPHFPYHIQQEMSRCFDVNMSSNDNSWHHAPYMHLLSFIAEIGKSSKA